MKDIISKLNESKNKKVTLKTHYGDNPTYDILGLDDDEFNVIFNLLDLMQQGKIKTGESSEFEKELQKIAKRLYLDLYDN
jgi:hypothetical protein